MSQFLKTVYTQGKKSMPGKTATSNQADDSVIGKLSKILTNLADWGVMIIMMVLPGIVDNYALVFGIAFGLAVVFMSFNAYQYKNSKIKVFPKVFEVGILLINLALLIFECVEKPSFDWSRKWTGLITSVCLLSLTLFSILIGKPFTIQFAMEKVSEEYWGTPQFMFINLCISAVWGLYFALSIMFALLSIYVYPDNSAARIAPGIIILVGALKFTSEFPERMRDHYRAQNKAQNSNSHEQSSGVSVDIETPIYGGAR